MWELDHKESWVPKNWCFWTVVLDKTLESPLDCMEIQPVNPKGNQSWIFIGRTDDEAEALILWLPDTRSWFTRKDPDDWKDWRQEEKGMTEDEVVGWHLWCDGCEFEQALGVGDAQGGLQCCSSWGCKEWDMTEQPNWIHSHTYPEKIFSKMDMEQWTGSKLGKEYVKAVYCHPAYLLQCRIHHVKCWAGWSTRWNQDCWEKYQ